jgi:hypothetical protein
MLSNFRSWEFWSWLENLAIAQEIGGTIWYPIVETLHVLAAVFVFGSLLMLDLRLLGVTARSQPVERMSRELLLWTWLAFALALMTGIGLFITRASAFVDNRAMQFKVLALLLAAVNMIVFQFGAHRRVAQWDLAVPPPASARFAGAASLFCWAGVMLAGRWIGHLI